ncbi:rRNA biogenesis protein rrp5 [Schizosaccharomyces pombe]
MAGNKRKRSNASEGSDSQGNERISSLSANEATQDFPRGGASSLTPLEYKEAVLEAKKDFMESASGTAELSKKTRPKKKGSKKSSKSELDNEENLKVHIQSLRYKNITPGSLILGQIAQINTLDLAVSLPNCLTGYVPITNISDKLSDRLDSIDNHAEDNAASEEEDGLNQIPDLMDLYKVGQWVRVSVTALGSENTTKTGKRHIELSLKPQDANGSAPEAADFVAGSMIQAVVSSIEDHGIVFDIGINNYTGFLSKKHINDFPFVEGQSLLCSVISKEDRIFHLSLTATSTKALEVMPSVQAILPGDYINVLVTDIKESGVIAKYMGVVDVTSDIYHSSPVKGEDLEDKFQLAKSVPARVLFVIPGDPPKIAVSFLPHVLTFNFATPNIPHPDQLDIGFIVNAAKVTYVSSSLGVFCDVGVPEISGFAHISRLSDKKVAGISPNSGPYKVDSTHEARIINYSYVDNLYILSFQQSVLNQQFLRIEDIEVGQFVDGTIAKLIPQGIVVTISEGINGLVPSTHMADIALQFPERRFKVGSSVKCRVLSTNVLRKRVLLTLKKSLLNTDLPLIYDYEQATPGTQTVGTLARIFEDGAIVEFYNSVRAFLPVSEMSEAYIRDAREHFKVGQTLSVTIVSCDPENRKMRVGCREQSWDAKRLERFENIKAGSVLSGIVLQKTEDSVIVDLGDKVTGVITLGQLCDGDLNKCSKVMNKLRASTKLAEVLVLRKDTSKKLISLSLKKSLVEAAKENRMPINITDLKEGIKYFGFVRNATTFGVFVEFCDGLVALVPKAYISEEYVPVPSAVYKPQQSVTCVCLSVELSQGKAFMSFKPLAQKQEKAVEFMESKYDIDNPVDETIKKTYDYVAGKITWAVVTSAKASQLNVDLAANVHGRVDVSEVFDNFGEIVDPNKPLKRFHKGDKIRVRVLGIHDSRNHKFLPISHRVSPKQFLELSVRPSILNMEPFSMKEPQFKKGDEVTGFVNNVSKECVWVSLTPSVNGRIPILDLTTDVKELNSLQKHFFLGKAIKCYVVNAEDSITLSAIGPLQGFENLTPGSRLVGKVTNVNEAGAILQLPGHMSGRVSRIDMFDDYDILPETKFTRNNLVGVCVLSVDVPNRKVALSARNSRTQSQPVEIKDKEINSVDDLKIGDICRGFVCNVANQGLFVTIGHNLIARVKIGELFDTFIKDWKPHFHVNQLVKGSIVGIDSDSKRIEMSLKQSKIKDSSEITKTFADIAVGSNLDGTVVKVGDYGVLIRIDGTDNIVGLCHKSEIADAVVLNISKLYSSGDKVRAHVLDVDSEKRRIALGLKSSYFDSDSDISMSDNEEDVEMRSEDQSDTSESEVGSKDDVQSEEVENLESAGDEDEDEEEEPSALQANGFDWTDGSTVFDKLADDTEDSEDEEDEEPKRKKSKSDRFDDEEKDLDEIPSTAADFERQLLSSPNSSLLWISYMAYHLNLNELQEAREVGKRALSTINYREEDEKLNVWMALLNLEVAYGTEDSLKEVFKEACAYCDALIVYEKLCGILIKGGKVDLADEYMQLMLKNFKQVPSVWIQYATFLLNNDKAEKAHGLLERSLQSLPKSEHVGIIEKFAILEFKNGDPERGRTIFEGLLSSYPKRLDLWNVLIDMEMKQDDPSIVRRLFQRLLALNLSTKKAKFAFKKWLAYEKNIGDDEGAEQVKRRAIEYVSESHSEN